MPPFTDGMWNWIRDNYGWQTKRTEWFTAAFALIILLTIIAVVVSSAGS